MAVAFDAVGPSSSGTGNATAGATGTQTVTWTHTAGSGANRYVVVGVSNGETGNAGTDTYTVTYGGTAMTLIGSVLSNNTQFGAARLYGLANPATGASTVSVQVAGTGTKTINCGSISFTGVDQTTPVGTGVTAFGSSGTPSVAVTGTSAANMVVDVLTMGSGSSTSNKTLRWSRNGNGNSAGGNGAQSTAASTAGTVTMSYNSGVDAWGVVAVEVKAAPVTPDPIASGAVVPNPTISTTVTASPSSVASGAVVPSPVVSTAITLSPSAIATGEAVPSPAVAYVTVVVPTSITSGQVVPSVGVSYGPPTQILAPVSITSGQVVPSINGVLYLLQEVTATSVPTGESVGQPSVTVQQPTTVFIGPVVQRRVPIDGMGSLAPLMNFGLAVFRIDGQWYESEFPPPAAFEEADLFFPGGHINPVDDDTAAILIAAGYETSEVFL